MKHSLKIEPQYLENLLSGKKTAEIRLNDRDYQVGDILEFYNHMASFGSRMDYVSFEVTHIHSGLGLKENYVVLSVKHSTTTK